MRTTCAASAVIVSLMFAGAVHARGWPVPPASWLHSSFAQCVRLRESHNGADPNAHGNIYGMLDGWAEAGGHGSAGDASRAEQDYRAYLLWRRFGVSPWRRYDGC